MITHRFNLCSHDQHYTAKTLTNSNQFEISIKQCNSVTFLSSIGTKSNFFMILFSVFDTKYDIPGSPFLEKKIRCFDIPDLTANLKLSFNDRLTVVFFTTLIDTIFPFFSFIYQINSKKPPYLNPNSVIILRFSPKKTKLLSHKPEKQ